MPCLFITSYSLSPPPPPLSFQWMWVEFMDGLSLLQRADISALPLASDELLCLFLNLYHLLLLHAFLVVGPPDSQSKWNGE